MPDMWSFLQWLLGRMCRGKEVATRVLSTAALPNTTAWHERDPLHFSGRQCERISLEGAQMTGLRGLVWQVVGKQHSCPCFLDVAGA
jgi:hypothetical protein